MWLSAGWRRTVVICWSLFAALAVLWDFSWCFVFRALQAPDIDHGWRRVWAIYGHVDHRYLQADPWLIVLEIVTGLGGSTLGFYVVYQLLRGRQSRARVALLVLSVMQVYGTVMYWGSELCNRFTHIDTSSPARTLLLFVGLNSLWLIFPGWCIYHLVVEYAGAEERVGLAWQRARVTPSLWSQFAAAEEEPDEGQRDRRGHDDRAAGESLTT